MRQTASSTMSYLSPARPFSHIPEGCENITPYNYTLSPTIVGDAAPLVDSAFGLSSSNGPCSLHSDIDGTWTAKWQAESVNVGGNYFYPATQVDFIEGQKDSPTEIKNRENVLGIMTFVKGNDDDGMRLCLSSKVSNPKVTILYRASGLRKGFATFISSRYARESLTAD
jgi:hypothetical protein